MELEPVRRTRPKSLTPQATYLCFREKLAGMCRKCCYPWAAGLMLACGAVFEFLQKPRPNLAKCWRRRPVVVVPVVLSE